MEIIKGGVTAAKGYEAASTAAGIKYQGRTDMAMIYSQVPCAAAGTFTTNVVKAAPVKWDQQVVKNGQCMYGSRRLWILQGYGKGGGRSAGDCRGRSTDRVYGCDREADSHRQADCGNPCALESKERYFGKWNGGGKGDHDDRYF